MPGPRPDILPFAALVGQAPLKRALLALAVNPRLQGLLIRGEKGTAKSTAALALAQLLPSGQVNEGCSYGCPTDRPRQWCADCRAAAAPPNTIERPAPFETLPLGVTEDQLLGTLDLEHVLTEGRQRFAPGLLARVNGGVLYVDEVNLLEDHLVDLLLDVAATGVNVVAREGVRLSHPAEFMLVGTMNPEEGELRPQLTDRFGLCVEVTTIADVEQRAEIVERRLAFEADPEAFAARFADAEADQAKQIAAARTLLPAVTIPRAMMLAAANLCLSLEIHGHRGELLMAKTAATLAALADRREVTDADLEEAATLVLPHRLRRQPFEDAKLGEADLRAAAREALDKSAATAPPGSDQKKNG